jgi:hypothetical protein
MSSSQTGPPSGRTSSSEQQETATLPLQINHAGDVGEEARSGFEAQSETILDRLHLGTPGSQGSQNLAALVELGGSQRAGDGDFVHVGRPRLGFYPALAHTARLKKGRKRSGREKELNVQDAPRATQTRGIRPNHKLTHLFWGLIGIR